MKEKQQKRRLQATGIRGLLMCIWLASCWQYTSGQQAGSMAVIVRDSMSTMLADATVTVTNARTGFSKSGVTDQRGMAILAGIPADSNYCVRVTYVGIAPSVRCDYVVSPGQRATVAFRMGGGQANNMDEVIVVGYGTVRKRDLTGAVSSIDIGNVRDMPVTSIDQALHGQAAGLQVTQTSGAPGAGASIRIRGGNSINGGNEPLFVIDGIPVFEGTGSLGSGALRSSGVNILATLNPADIASIEVLKDASATAIYGSRGANGVILVTTKAGGTGESRIDANLYTGIQRASNIPRMLRADQYATAINRYNAAVGKPAEYTADAIAAMGGGTNWMDEVLRVAPLQNVQLSAQGGEGTSKYYLSGGYFSQQGIISNSKLDRYSLTLNLQKRVNDRLTIHNNTLLSYSINSGVISEGGYSNTGVSSVIYSALQYDPISPVKDASGRYVFSPLMESARLSNPAAIVNEVDNLSKIVRLVENLSLDYRIMEGLRLKVLGGVDFMTSKESFYESRQVLEGRDNDGLARLGSVQNYGFLNENTLHYTASFGSGHRVDAVAGFTLQSNRMESMNAAVKGFVTDALGADNLGAGSGTLPAASNVVDWSLVSSLGRVNYAIADRFLFTLTARYDGSSRFGSGSRFGFFPSGAVAWRLAEEDFIKRWGVFSDLKARVSYGITGNQAIAPYQSIARLATSRTIFNDQVHIGFSPANLANPLLGWEQTGQFDAGLDAGILGGKLSMSIDYYHKRTTDLLFSRNIQQGSGFSSVMTNQGELTNRGVEAHLQSSLRFGGLTWETGLNLSHNRSKVIDMGATDRYFVSLNEGGAYGSVLVEVGQPLGNFYGYVSDGIFSDADDVARSAQPNAHPGDRKFRDISGPDGVRDGVITDADRTVLGNAQPRWQFGWSNRLSVKGFDLNLVLQGVQGNSIYNSQRMYYENFLPYGNVSTAILEAWSPEHPDSDIPRFGSGNESRPYQLSSRFIEDGSYLRLKNITAGYRFPAVRFSTSSVTHFRIFVSAQDLLTFTRYTGFDPEVNRYNQDNLRQGVDLGGYPRAKTYTLGVSISL